MDWWQNHSHCRPLHSSRDGVHLGRRGGCEELSVLLSNLCPVLHLVLRVQLCDDSHFARPREPRQITSLSPNPFAVVTHVWIHAIFAG